MDRTEYYLILPLLLYGLAIADLINSWRNLFLPERRYYPYILTSVLLLETAFWNFFQMYGWMETSSFASYLTYWKFILPPLTFLVIVSVFTPDTSNVNIKEYFLDNMRIIFGGLIVFVALHLLLEPTHNLPTRLGVIVLLAVTAISKKIWLIYVIAIFRIVTLILFT
ncbi:MAG: chromate transporter [Flammeovirgaceae bacterium]|nr:chromate transporter [Flammeovirgaceae bacterium]